MFGATSNPLVARYCPRSDRTTFRLEKVLCGTVFGGNCKVIIWLCNLDVLATSPSPGRAGSYPPIPRTCCRRGCGAIDGVRGVIGLLDGARGVRDSCLVLAVCLLICLLGLDQGVVDLRCVFPSLNTTCSSKRGSASSFRGSSTRHYYAFLALGLMMYRTCQVMGGPRGDTRRQTRASPAPGASGTAHPPHTPAP